MACQIEQRRADGSRGAYHEYRRTPRNGAAAREHLKRRDIGQRHAHCRGRIDAIGNRYEESRGTNRILGVATDHAQVGDHFTLRQRSYARADLVDDTDDLVARRKRQSPLKSGYRPRRIMVSVKPVPAAITLMRTSPEPGTGTVSSSTTSNTSGPPNREIRMCRQVMGRAYAQARPASSAIPRDPLHPCAPSCLAQFTVNA